MAKLPAYQVVVMPECFTKTVPADGQELTHNNWQEKCDRRIRKNRPVNKEDP